MLHRIFNKRGANAPEKGRKPAVSVPPSWSHDETVAQPDTASLFDIAIDDVIRVLDSELADLGRFEVTQAAKERGWATLQRQLEKHPVRATSPSLLKGAGSRGAGRGGVTEPVLAGRSRGWRLALGSVGVAVAIVAVLLGTYSAGLLGGGDDTGPLVSASTTQVASSGTTAPTSGTTAPTTDTTPATVDDPGTTLTTEGTPITDSTPVTTERPTPTTDSTPVTTEVSTPSTGGGTVTTHKTTPTTAPAQTTTTNEQQMAAAEREKDAVATALHLGDAVLDKFIKGDLGSLPDITDAARARLTQLIANLNAPTGCQKVAVKDLTDGKVRVTLEFVDGDERPRVYVTVRVVDGGTTVIDITAGS